MATLLEQLDAILRLEPNWDGYDAARISPTVVTLAKGFVDLIVAVRRSSEGMHVTPGRDGGVLIEWTSPTHDHEMEINPDGSIGFLHTDKASGAMTERRLAPVAQVVDLGVLSEIQRLVAA